METALSTVQQLATRLKADSGFESKRWAVTSTHASKLGHPCGERYLFYLRTNWEQMAVKNWLGLGIKGNLIHDWWKMHMMQKGYTVVQNEAPLSEDLRRKYGIGGRIDGKIAKDTNFLTPYEFKTMNEHTYKKTNSVEDLQESDKSYLRSYVAQLQIYLYDHNAEYGLFILCNEHTLEWKAIVVALDLEYVEALLKKAEAVKNAYDSKIEKNPFERIPYGSTCKSCEFAHLCLPDIINDGLDFIDNQHLEEILKERDSLYDVAKQFDKLDAEAKEIAKTVGKDFIVGDTFAVQIKKSEATKYDMPPEVKKQYAVKYEKTAVTFLPMARAAR